LVNEFAIDDQLDTHEDDPWWLGKLDWPGTDITQFLFSTTSDIYLVVRPELTARSIEHKIPIIHIDLRTKRLDTLIIGSLVGRFYSTFSARLPPLESVFLNEK
jgi:hypothetical protein